MPSPPAVSPTAIEQKRTACWSDGRLLSQFKSPVRSFQSPIFLQLRQRAKIATVYTGKQPPFRAILPGLHQTRSVCVIGCERRCLWAMYQGKGGHEGHRSRRSVALSYFVLTILRLGAVGHPANYRPCLPCQYSLAGRGAALRQRVLPKAFSIAFLNMAKKILESCFKVTKDFGMK